MRKLIVLGIVFLVMLIPAHLFASSCESVQEGAEYYINFTAGGVEHSCTFGATDINTGDPFAAVQPDDTTFIMGISEQVAYSENPTGDYVYIEGYINAISEGTYAYLNEDFNLYIDIIDGGVTYLYGVDSGTLTISTFGEVGEAVEGSFEVHVLRFIIANFTPLLENEYDITGSFRLKRVEYIYD